MIATLMGAATLIIFVAVVHRYAAGVAIRASRPSLLWLNLTWAQELCIYMFVWMAKFGAAYGVRTGIHVGVDVLINAAEPRWREQFDRLRAARRGAVHRRRRRVGRRLRLANSTTPTRSPPTWRCRCGWSTGRADRLVADVLPLPAGLLEVHPDRRIAAPRPRPCRRPRSRDRSDHGGDRKRRAPAHGREVMTAVIIFGLLIALMLTGMPISISLGLTVLTFLFTMTEVPIESVALKLFTGIEKFEIMAIPFFILAGNFLTHGGVARRMIHFATAMVGHWHGGLAWPA